MRVIGFALALTLAGCAIEGVGFDGRINAYTGAAKDSREYVTVHPGTRDSGWYAGWCDSLRPHFQRMQDQSAEVDRYCSAMQEQPDNAESIRAALVKELVNAKNDRIEHRNAVVAGLSAFNANMQAATPRTVTCSSTAYGNTATTTCR